MPRRDSVFMGSCCGSDRCSSGYLSWQHIGPYRFRLHAGYFCTDHSEERIEGSSCPLSLYSLAVTASDTHLLPGHFGCSRRVQEKEGLGQFHCAFIGP
jgi:hypothetical protein